ncbi:twin-arginine translocation signal domain-containing protein [Natrarchaeobius halalkaliphilus]|uniref:Twin-arginine translocation signal domain-containing protein n=1 Tax=Natrarchaeobius halalkaliphilus TaxID=1679091 RepID=A0A3N6P997_9EURY|nr:S8 family peptidase [Natrarchaeobius halalkaliphilus]RQG92775.1 twin-arginine translocation signal domain-containing protein [Natrarchaeobius halalkaliphilus]
MTLSRRQLLQGVGAGVSAGLVGTVVSEPASASSSPSSDTRRVFVHPENGLLGDLLDAVEGVGGTTLLEFDNFEFVVAEVPSNRVSDLAGAAGIAFVEDDEETGIPDDWSPSLLDVLVPPDRSDCSTHPDQRTSWGLERIGADDVDPGGSDVDVGILDTGIQSDHCSLSVAGGRNFTATGTPSDYEDRHGHGTHVAGIAGAVDNDLGMVGTAPDTNLYAVKVLDDDGRGRYSELVAGIDWCLSNDIELISMSLGGENESETVDDVIETATSDGHLLLTAAGNEGNAEDGSCDEETMTYPATHDDVLAVAAMDEDDTLASYSSVGSAVDLLAPGTEITSTITDNEYAEASGTSIACPFVTGVAALVWGISEADGPGPNDAIRRTLTDSAEPVLETCEEGHGLVDARAAVDGDVPDADDSSSDREGEPTDRGESRSALEWLADAVSGLLERIRELFG